MEKVPLSYSHSKNFYAQTHVYGFWKGRFLWGLFKDLSFSKERSLNVLLSYPFSLAFISAEKALIFSAVCSSLSPLARI